VFQVVENNVLRMAIAFTQVAQKRSGKPMKLSPLKLPSLALASAAAHSNCSESAVTYFSALNGAYKQAHHDDPVGAMQHCMQHAWILVLLLGSKSVLCQS